MVKALYPTLIKPDHLTLASAAAGISSGIFIAAGEPLNGAILLMLAMILDCADGQLARMRGGGSRLGRILDGVADYITAAAVHAGIALYLSTFIYRAWLWVLAGALAMALHCIYFDFRKQWFLARISPKESEMDSLESVNKNRDKNKSLAAKLMLKVYHLYLRIQPGSRYEKKDLYIISREGQKDFTDKAGNFMHSIKLLGPATHNFLIFITLVAAVFIKDAPFFYINFNLIALNMLFLSALIWGGKLDKSLIKE